MKIALEARSLSRPSSGITTYVRELTQALTRVEPQHTYDILDQGPAREALWPLWLNTTVPAWLSRSNPDLVHFTKAAVPQIKKYPTVVTIYDVIPLLFPQSQKFIPRLTWPSVLRHAATSADHILTISEASKRDIVEHLRVAPEKITVTALATNSTLEVKNLKPPTVAASTPYILFVGTIEPRKNVPALIRAFAQVATQIPHRLIIAGRPYKGIDEVRDAIRNSGYAERIELRDFVPSEELPSLYADADVFVWPSIYEGWGFPPQEAMAAGVPVIVSNGGSLPEVVGQAGNVVPFTVDTIAARTHDEGFEAALASSIQAVLTNPARQAVMRETGLSQVSKTTWIDIAHATLAVYAKVLKS